MRLVAATSSGDYRGSHIQKCAEQCQNPATIMLTHAHCGSVVMCQCCLRAHNTKYSTKPGSWENLAFTNRYIEQRSVKGWEVVTPPPPPPRALHYSNRQYSGSLEGNGGSQSAQQPPPPFWFPNLTSGKLKFCYVNNFCWHNSLTRKRCLHAVMFQLIPAKTTLSYIVLV